jgi:iron complex transport system permease protein
VTATAARATDGIVRRGARVAILRTRRARVAGALVLGAGVLLVAIASLAIGSVELPADTVLAALFAYDGSNDHVIVRELRGPRTLLGLAAGASLALAGGVLQALTRNPLAEPGIFGVNAGASLAVVASIAFLGTTGPAGYVWFAFAGAAATSLAVFALGAVGRPEGNAVRVALAGVVLAAVLGSITAAILVLDASTLDRYRFWAVGSLAGQELSALAGVLPFLVVGAAIALGTGRQLDTLSLGDDVARGLGLRVGLIRTLGTAAQVLLTGSVVAVAGPIGFVGLAAPHAARVLVGAGYPWILATSALIGAALLVAADIVGRIVLRPGEVEVGIMTAFVGVPLFLWLVRRRRIVEV